MNSSIFNAISALDELKIPFKLKEDLLLDWLLELAKKEDNQQACLTILQLLKTLNKTKLDAKNRFSFLTTIHVYLKSHIGNLEGTCWDACFPISSQEQKYAEIVACGYFLLSEGFFIAAQDFLNKVDEMLALQMTCYCLGQAQLHIAAVYKNPDPFFWQTVYKVFAWVEKYKLLEIKISNRNLENISLIDIFAQIFIFESCNTNQFRPRDMLTVFDFLPKVCKGFSVYRLSDVKFQTEILKVPYIQAVANSFDAPNKLAEKINKQPDLFVFDLNQELPPLIFNQTYLLSTNSLRYFVTGQVVKNLEVATKEAWSGVLKSINQELFSRVIRSLAPGKKRKYTRSETEHNMLGVIGFENIVSFLYRAKAGYKNVLQNTQEQTEQTASIWKNKSTIEDIASRSFSLKRMAIFNHSVRGYLLNWADDESSKSKIGDIFAIISDDKKRLEIAVIRRIVAGTAAFDDYRFGAEILGFDSEAVMISHAQNPTLVGWVIFIPAIKQLEQADSIIYPVGNFRVGDAIAVYKDNKSVKAVIARELNASVAVMHVELDYGVNSNT